MKIEIMKHSLTILLLLCSMAVIGQNKIDSLTSVFYSSNGRSFTMRLNQHQDTAKVIMLTTKETDLNKPVQLIQIEGYSVTPRYVFNYYPRAYYLNIHKQPMPDDVIVWMSIQK